MPFNGEHVYVSQEIWDSYESEVRDGLMVCDMPVGGPYTRPGRINAVDNHGQPGYSSRFMGWENDEVGTEIRWDVNDDISYFGAIWSPYKMWNISDDIVLLKIINFGDDETGHESMWVEVTDGDEHEGIGILKNQPFGIPWLNFGDVIRYGEGNFESKARFIEKITEEE